MIASSPPPAATEPSPDVYTRLRRFTRTSGPALLVVACALAACTSSSSVPRPQTARVQRATVSTAVSSSGALSASTEQNLGFNKGGRLTSVAVKVGDRVAPGQVLAAVDDVSLRHTLAQQQAQLDAQRAVLTRLVNSTTVRGAVNSVEQAQAILSATEDQARATREADESALKRAQKQLDFDEDARDDADDRRDADKKACAASRGSGSVTTGGFSRSVFTSPAMARAMAMAGGSTTGGTTPGTSTAPGTSTGTGGTAGHPTSGTTPGGTSGSTPGGMSGTTPGGTPGTTPGGSTGSAPGSTGSAGGSTGTGATDPGATGPAAAAPMAPTSTDTGTFSAMTSPVDPVGSGACNRLQSDESTFTMADRQVVASRTARDAARERRDVDEAAGRLSIENARQGLVGAQNERDSASTDRPSTIAQQQALVDGAAAAVRQAQQDVDDTVLRAPVAGTVSVLNGAVGEYVEGGSATSALAPGSGAAIPGTGGAAAAPATSAVARPGGTQFLVLDGVDTFQVVVPFEESDAARIAPAQNVDVTFAAVPELERHGTVLAVAPAATATSGVVSYYVTVVLTETDARLRDGQTAQAAVHTDELRDVAAVPNSAVRREGGRTVVTTLGFDGVRRTVPFEPGVVGDDLTQVVSGLTVGDEVVVSDPR